MKLHWLVVADWPQAAERVHSCLVSCSQGVPSSAELQAWAERTMAERSRVPWSSLEMVVRKGSSTGERARCASVMNRGAYLQAERVRNARGDARGEGRGRMVREMNERPVVVFGVAVPKGADLPARAG